MMDFDERIEMDNDASFCLWISRYDDMRERIPGWVSTFHKDQLRCKLSTDKFHDSRGAYNMSCKVEFDSGEKWMVRFPMVGKVINADWKVDIEVATMKLVRERTTIPIPEVKSWGQAVDNPLGLGPFIMLGFVEGIGLDQILQTPNERLMRPDISDEIIESIFRQTIDFLLQLSRLNFSCIGSLTSKSSVDESGYAATIHSRPLTIKAHEVLCEGGIDVFGPRDQTFSSTTEYFNSIVDGDLQHLYGQPNSVDDEEDAKEKYIYFKVMKALISRHVLPSHDQGPFRLLCDDFQPTNMIVNNEHDLKIVGVLDWEWSYAAPAQLAHSTPLWLLIQSPNIWSTSDERLTRFEKYSKIYKRILEEEEGKLLWNDTAEEKKPSALLSASQRDGREWFHAVLLRGFNGPRCVPFTKLREETKDWSKLAATIPEEEVNSFVRMKVEQLEKFRKQTLEIKNRYDARQDLQNFLTENSAVLSLDSHRYEWQKWDCFTRRPLDR